MKLLSTFLLFFSVSTVYAEEIRSLKIVSVGEVTVIRAPKGCTDTVKGHFGFGHRKKEVDCYALLLKDVSAAKLTDNQEENLGDILLMPIETLAEAHQSASSILMVLNGTIPEGTSATLSTLRYVEGGQKLTLDLFTKDKGDQGKPIKAGGITITVVTPVTEGNVSGTHTETESLGLQ